MTVVFSEHANYQLKRRKLSKKRVLKVIYNFDEMKPSFRERELRRKRFGDKILEVVTKTEGSKITVITAYFLEENENKIRFKS